MAQALTSMTKKYGKLVMCYVDDVVVVKPMLKDRIDRLDKLLYENSWLKKHSLSNSIKKDENKLGVRPNPDEVEAVLT